MKIKTSSRIAAIVLALMMIVPLISVPTFAADSNVIVDENFNGGVLADTCMSAMSSDYANLIQDTADASNYYLKLHSTTTTGQNPGVVSITDTNNLTIPYSANTVMVLEQDVYVPYNNDASDDIEDVNTAGSLKMRCQLSGFEYSGKQYSAAVTPEFWDIRMGGQYVYLTTTAGNTTDSLQRQTARGLLMPNNWYKITTKFNLTTGLVTLYVNGVTPMVTVNGESVPYSYNLYHTNTKVALAEVGIYGVIVGYLTDKAEGTVYLDNIKLYTETVADSTAIYSADYSNGTGVVTSKLGKEDLYSFDFDNELFRVGSVTTPIKQNATNNVKVILGTYADNKLVADIYLNGVCVDTREFDATEDATWDAGSGSATVEVETVTYNESLLKKTAIAEDVIYVTYNGINYINRTNTFKTYNLDDAAYTDAVTASKYLDNLGLIKTLDKASIRMSDPTGLRFATQVNVAVLDAIKALGMEVAEMGTLIAPKVYGTLNLEDFVAFDGVEENITEKTILKVVATAYNEALGLDENDTTHHFVGSIVGIKDGTGEDGYNNIDLPFSGRGYMTVKLPNGTSYNVYSANTKSISVKAQAQATIDEGIYEKDSAEDKILVGYAGNQTTTDAE